MYVILPVTLIKKKIRSQRKRDFILPLYETGERLRGPSSSIHHKYIEGYLYSTSHKGLGSPARVIYSLSLCVL
jgi:hypothetical protein